MEQTTNGMKTDGVMKNIRNIAVVAHSGAGKTTLIEGLLFLTGAIKKKSSSAEGKAVMLTEPEEVSHHTAVSVHVGHFDWKDSAIYFADTPGSFNFLEMTRGTLPCVDGALFLFTGTEGVKPETERLWGMLDAQSVPVIGFVNQLDKENADLGAALTKIERCVHKPVEPLSFPMRQGKDLVGIVDLIRQKAFTLNKGKVVESEIPDAMKDELTRARVHLIERIVESDDSLLEKYLGGVEISEEELFAGLKAAVVKRSFLPVLCGAADSDIGLPLLLDYMVQCLPQPTERDEHRPVMGATPGSEDLTVHRNCVDTAPFSAQVLKTTIDPFFGKLSIIRVFSGEVKGNLQVLNSSRNLKQKTGHTYLLQGKELAQVDILRAGEIGAIAKLEETHTGDTLCSTDAPIVYPAVKFAEPSTMYAVETQDKTDDKVAAALLKLADEDPSLHFYRDEVTHQMILAGMGQTHIEVTLEKLERKFGAHATLKAPKVAYRETIKASVKVQGKLKKQTGGHGQFANTWLEISPLPRGTGFEFCDKIVGGVIPKQYIPSVKKGVQEAMQQGMLGGYPVVDVKVELYDGSFHDVDSSDFAFQVAGSLGFKAGMEQARPVLLEPIMSVRVVVPDECAGGVIKDITGRRGKVLNFDVNGDNKEIFAEVPMAEMLEYGRELSGMTSGRGTYTMHIASYHEVPQHISSKVLSEIRKQPAHA